MNSITIKINMENPKTISVFAEERTTKGNILKKFVPNLIKSDLLFNILTLVSQINQPQQRTLMKSFLKENYVKKLYL